MAQLVVGGVGAAIGSAIPGVGTMMGFSIGMTIGGLLFPPQMSLSTHYQDRNVQGADYGAAIPIVFGNWRVTGSCIWANTLHEFVSDSGGGGGSI